MLPHLEKTEDFDIKAKDILKSNLLNKEDKLYLKGKITQRCLWSKAFFKSEFCCGATTTGRVESKHRLYKRFLNSSKRLGQLFKVFKDLEGQEITAFKEEMMKKSNQEEMSRINRFDVVQHFVKHYSQYSMSLFKDQVIESVNYTVGRNTNSNNSW